MSIDATVRHFPQGSVDGDARGRRRGPASRGRPAWADAAGRTFAGDVARCLACITRARFVAVQPARGAILPKFRTRKAANGLG